MKICSLKKYIHINISILTVSATFVYEIRMQTSLSPDSQRRSSPRRT